MRRLFASASLVEAFFALGSAVMFVIALVSGAGLISFVFLGTAIWWALFSRFTGKQRRAARRHRELRRRRLERERKGLAPPRG